jgi:hypothetical protein
MEFNARMDIHSLSRNISNSVFVGYNARLKFASFDPTFCETWSFTPGEEPKLRVIENRTLRRIFGPNRDEVAMGGEGCIMRSFMTCTLHQILLE